METNDDIRLKQRAAGLSVISNTILIVVKFVTGIVTGSFSVISEAIHSMSDLLASFIAFFAVKKASEPADKEHAFGHGKYEDFSGLIEGLLIILASIYILWESSMKIIDGKYEAVEVDVAIYVMLFSVFANIFVSAYLFRCAKKTGSVALYADAEHLRTDVYTAVGVMTGLALIKITGLHIIDPLIAIFVAVLIWEAGFKICRKTVADLLDTSLSAEEEKEITDTITSVQNAGMFRLCELKTRRSGVRKQIELKICVNGDMTVKESHEFCNEVENALAEKIGNTDTIIHIEPICENEENTLKIVINQQ